MLTVLLSVRSGFCYTEQFDLELPNTLVTASTQTDGTENAPAHIDLNYGEDASRKPDDVPQSSERAQVPSVGTYLRGIPRDMLEGTKGIIARDNLAIGLIGAGLTGLSFPLDHGVKGYFQDRRPLNGAADVGNWLGQWTLHVGIGAGLFGAGELFGDKKIADTGMAAVEALIVSGIITEGLKYTIGRTRPNGSGDEMSFPSGHVSSTATLAATISEMYDWDLRLAIPLYLTTAFVGASRIQSNMHYLSDVVAGMTVGTIVGKSFAKSFKDRHTLRESKQQFSISPLLGGDPMGKYDVKGVLFNWKF